MNKHKNLKIAYIGGGSREWARKLMSDLALDENLGGEIRLYDIDRKAADNNAKLGMLYQNHPKNKANWNYIVKHDLKEALENVNFVIISIMPATFDEMSIYVHHPEKYGIYQSVGDTTGPAGVMRSLIVMPIFVEFAKMIEKYAPEAWVINFTNPMTMCLQSLYEGFPKIKAYGNCHEVFGSQKDLAAMFNELKGKELATREDIHINVSGINHFTWITEASCFGEDLMPLYKTHVGKYGDINGIHDKEDFHKGYPFTSENQVKYDLYKKYNCMAAAGDRHLAEFMPKSLYLSDLETIKKYKFHLTPIQWRKDRLKEQQAKTELLIEGKEQLDIIPSGEEGTRQIKALLGLETLITNINFINIGQAAGLPLGQVVETNAVFRYNSISPMIAKQLPQDIEKLIKKHMTNHELLLLSYRERNLKHALMAMANDPLCEHLDYTDIEKMFDEMVEMLKNNLRYYNL